MDVKLSLFPQTRTWRGCRNTWKT